MKPHLICCAVLFTSAATASFAAPVAVHTHGQVLANVALQGNTLSVQLELPQESLLGFEHRPRTDAQRKAAQAALQQLKNSAVWLKPDAAAVCTLKHSEINAVALEAAKPGAASPPGAAKAEPAHADVDASWEFTCAAPEKLTGLDMGLMSLFQRVQRVDVQVVGNKGQHKQTLRRPATRVLLVR